MKKMLFAAVVLVLASSASAYAACPQGWDVTSDPVKCLTETHEGQPVTTFSIMQWNDNLHRRAHASLDSLASHGVDYTSKEGTNSFSNEGQNPALRLGLAKMYRDRYGKPYFVESCPFQEGLYGEAELCLQKGLTVVAGLLKLNGVENDRAAYFEAAGTLAGLGRRLDLFEEQVKASGKDSQDILEQLQAMRGELPGIRQSLKDWKVWLDTPVNDRTSG